MSDLSTISIMFEEIKQALKGIQQSFVEAGKNSTANQESRISTSDLVNIETKISQSEEQMLSKLEQIEQAQSAPRKIDKRITIDIKSSWTFLTLIGLSFFLITSLILCYRLKQENDRLSNNDIKYRYIKAQGSSDTLQISQLEDIFEYKRNEKIIRQIKTDVQNYERSVIEQAQRLEQARLKEKEAKGLQNEAERLKQNK